MMIEPLRQPAALAAILERTAALGFNMASEPLTGALLQTLAASKPGGRMLEIGTGTGISAAWLLSGMDAASTLVSVDADARPQQIAKELLGGDARLEIVTEDGLTFLQRDHTARFDLVFADAMPGKYEGLEHALAVVKPGGFFVIDDLLPQANWPEGHAAKVPVLIERLAGDAGFHMVPMAWASGIVVAVKLPRG
jgi:predicted O-methyltransferase YrrM